MKQYEVISKSLPITSESAIFFRRDTENVGLFKFAIIPNEDTPYKFGVFVFDAFLPENYPDIPPVVNHSTSRKNNFRFNPNLYSNGYVCLSILGTWTGDSQSTKWIPMNANGTGSTLYQVIMSIYSMVFSEEPWYNEPGRERGISNASTNTFAIEYNKEIRDGTIKYAIFNQLKYPEEGFEDVIKEHFKLKKDKIIEYLTKLNRIKDAELFATLI
jgi:baculoviral IAP repeat-containing protein 6